MLNLFLIYESFTNGYNHFFLNFISLASILSGILVIITKNPIVSVLFLIGLFLSIAGYLMILGINFIGLSYLLVYVGAVSILFLFILMLINVRISELVSDTSNSIPLAIFIGILFNSTLYDVIPRYNNVNNVFSIRTYYFNFNDKEEIVFVSSQTWDSNLAETSHITTIGNILYTAYPIWLIITSIILLLAMVGAIVITIKQK
jgi:NADH-ubiquinone oxidoreductase chain 6